MAEPTANRSLEPTVRPFAEAHIDRARDLWQATEHMCLSSADSPRDLRAFLRRNPGCSFVALDEGRLVGTCLCGHDGRRGHLYHLAVSRSHRPSGLGTRLVESCLNALREAGIGKCHAFVTRASPYGRLFWEPLGWHRRDDLFVHSIRT